MGPGAAKGQAAARQGGGGACKEGLQALRGVGTGASLAPLWHMNEPTRNKQRLCHARRCSRPTCRSGRSLSRLDCSWACEGHAHQPPLAFRSSTRGGMGRGGVLYVVLLGWGAAGWVVACPIREL